MKKIISIVMVVAMIAALAFTVSADDTAAAPTDGLLAHFTFDDAETGLTGNGAKATPSTVTATEGEERRILAIETGATASISEDAAIGGGAYQFDGTSFLTLTKEDGSGLLDGVDSLTISYWAKTDTTTQWPFFATPNFEGGPKSQIYLKETYFGILENNGTHAELYNSPANNNQRSYSTSTPTATIFNGEWHHVIVVVDTDNEDETLRKVTVYVDGYFDSESTQITIEQHKLSELLGSDYSVMLGYAPWGYNDNPAHEGEFSNSLLDDVYIYGRALNDDEVKALDAASAMPKEDPPETDAPGDDTEKAPAGTDKTPADTNKPADNSTETSAPADEGGCGSTLGAAAAVVALTAVFGCAIVKKH